MAYPGPTPCPTMSQAQVARFSVCLVFKSSLTKPVYQKLVMLRDFVER